MNVSRCHVAVHVGIEEGDPEEAVAEEEVSEGPGNTCSIIITSMSSRRPAALKLCSLCSR